MQTPPPVYASGPRKSNVGLIIAIVVGAIAVCCVLPIGVLGYFGVNMFHKALGFFGCGWTLEQMRDGMVAYAKNHGGKLPAKEHWQEDIGPYLKPIPGSEKIKLPPMNGDVCDLDSGSSACYNADLAGKKLASIEDPTTAVLLWETPGRGRDKSEPYKEPAYATGPKLFGNVPRGWVIQPVTGEAYYQAGQDGTVQQIPPPGKHGNSMKIDVGDSDDQSAAGSKPKTGKPSSSSGD